MSLVRPICGCALCCLLLLVGANSANALDLVIPIDTVIVSGLSDGDTVVVARVSSGSLEGSTCEVRSVHRIESEPRPGNDLIVSSNNERILLADVERESGAVTTGSVPLTASELITVELVMGPSEIFGGAVDVELDCGSSPAEAEAEPPASESSTSQPTELPATGVASFGVVAVAALLIAAGAGLVAAGRRSRTGVGENEAAGFVP